MKDTAHAARAETSLEDESWAVIVEVDDAPSEGECYDTQSAFTSSSALAKTESELYDSGASRHMSPFQHRFTNLRSIPPRPIIAANNRVFYANGLGDLKVDVPDMTLTVISISKIASAGYAVSFEGQECKIKNKKGKTIGRIPATTNGLIVSR